MNEKDELMALLKESDISKLYIDVENRRCRICGSGFYDGYYAMSGNICCKIIELKNDLHWSRDTNRRLNREKQALESILSQSASYKIGFFRGRSQLVQELASVLARVSDWKINIYTILKELGMRKSITKGMRYESLALDKDPFDTDPDELS